MHTYVYILHDTCNNIFHQTNRKTIKINPNRQNVRVGSAAGIEDYEKSNLQIKPIAATDTQPQPPAAVLHTKV